jgi:chromatin remodeling complex protein RSC6
MRNRRVLALGLIVAAALSTGCSSWAKKSGYAMLPDEPFYTAAASGAILGSYGVKPDKGAFERLGRAPGLADNDTMYTRTTLTAVVDSSDTSKPMLRVVNLSPNLGKELGSGQVLAIEVVDLDKQRLINKLNSNDGVAIRDTLARSDDMRLVTATATVLGPYVIADRNVTPAVTNEGGDVVQPERVDVTYELDPNAPGALSAGTVFGYQISRAGWSLDGETLVALQTDYPGTKDDAFSVEAYTRAEVDAERQRQIAEEEAAKRQAEEEERRRLEEEERAKKQAEEEARKAEEEAKKAEEAEAARQAEEAERAVQADETTK